MRSFIGILSLLVFMVIVVLLFGIWFERTKVEMESKCTETRAALGLCK